LSETAERCCVPPEYVQKLEGDLAGRLVYDSARRELFAFLAAVDGLRGA
jgi:hypothetical protein